MRKLCFLLLLACSLPAVAQLQTGDDVAVTDTESGKVRGFIRNGIFTYKGIPYGKADRFHAATKPEAWDGVRSSMSWGPVSPLMNETTQVMDEVEFVFDHDWGYPNEDCLVLNVWTPGIDDGKKRPVLFWLHGGGFAAGSSQELPSYHGENLAKKGDVVVVSINHRLNILGFLDLSSFGEEYATSANNSMLDARLALEWVRDNIENFGGDPDNVLIYGQSGGGAKVNTLMAMPSAKGLFHKAVNQSGAFRGEMITAETSRMLGERTVAELGLDGSSIADIESVPYDTLVAAGQRALQKVSSEMRESGETIPGFGLSWGPSVDGDVLPYQMFAPEALELAKDVPLLIGTVKNEFMPSGRAGLTDASREEIMTYLKNQYGEKAETFVQAVGEAYPDDSKPSDIIDVDMVFRPGAVHQANLKSSLEGGAPVYMYLFTWQSPVLNGRYKAMHCMELPFVFDNIQRCEQMTGGGPGAQALADDVSQAWINFARTGDPNHPGLPTWPKYTEEEGATMMLDNVSRVRNHPDKTLLDFMSQASR